MSDIADNLDRIRQNVDRAAQRAGTNPRDVCLVAVTKNVNFRRINDALAAGITDIGENRLQEAREKFPDVTPGARWHFIGHLQRNKVKEALQLFSLVQSLDRLSLGRELDKNASQLGVPRVDCLVQVNVASEDSKYGVAPQDLPGFLREVMALPRLRLRGLMTIAPYAADAEETRPVFRQLRILWQQCREEQEVEMDILSMGMTNDYTVAVEEGSTMIRVGTALFGDRHQGGVQT